MIPPVDQLGLVERALTTTTRDGEEVRLLVATRRFPFAADEVWGALTDPARIPRWFGPVSGDLREGGTFQIEGNAGGSILRCAPPRDLAVTWEFGGQVSWVDVALVDDGDGSVLRLEHTAPVDPAMWQEFGPGAVGIGWEMALMGLDEHLRSPDSAPGEVQAWLEGSEGRAYLTECIHGASSAWADASITAGTHPEQARSAAERCTTAYTAWPEAGEQ